MEQVDAILQFIDKRGWPFRYTFGFILRILIIAFVIVCGLLTLLFGFSDSMTQSVVPINLSTPSPTPGGNEPA